MTRFLPVFIFLLSTFYFLLATSVFAQDVTPTVTPAPQLNPQVQGNAWESFKNALIPNTLKDVNCSNLPLEACTGVKPTTNTTLSTQATGNKTGNEEIVGNAAGEYIIASGIHTPPQVAQASTNILADFLASIASAIANIFDRGETQAKNYAGTVLPQEVTNQNFAENSQEVTGFASGETNVLGIQSGQSIMDQALPLVQCAELPKELADTLCNKTR